MADEKNALEAFWRVKKNDYEDNETALLQYKNDLLCMSVWAIAEFNRRLELNTKPQASSPYDRVIGGVEVDLWTLAEIYGITSHRLFSAWKKITMAGRRGPKDKLRDLKEARVGLDKEIAKLEAEGVSDEVSIARNA